MPFRGIHRVNLTDVRMPHRTDVKRRYLEETRKGQNSSRQASQKLSHVPGAATSSPGRLAVVAIKGVEQLRSGTL